VTVRAAYFDCSSGASGNMLLGALLDAGAPDAAVEAAIRALGLQDAATVRRTRLTRGDVEATHVDVEVHEPPRWRSVGDIDRLIAGAELEEGVRERARLAFRLLGQAEARAHGVALESVRLHETGAVDALVDVVGTFAAADALGVEAFYSSALPLCHAGTVESAHGTIPLPAPATVNILEAAGAPTYTREGEVELVTPTGAAILGACAVFETPVIDAEREGFGAGTAELAWSNVLHVVVGELREEAAARAGDLQVEQVVVIETNIDDMAPNILADVPRRLLDAGALDAFVSPVVMKKGRAAHVVTAVVAPARADAVAELLIRETSTLGVRMRDERRLVAGRRLERMTTSLGDLDVKLKLIGGRVVAAVPEMDQVRELAERAGVPLHEAHQRLGDEARRKYL